MATAQIAGYGPGGAIPRNPASSENAATPSHRIQTRLPRPAAQPAIIPTMIQRTHSDVGCGNAHVAPRRPTRLIRKAPRPRAPVRPAPVGVPADAVAASGASLAPLEDDSWVPIPHLLRRFDRSHSTPDERTNREPWRHCDPSEKSDDGRRAPDPPHLEGVAPNWALRRGQSDPASRGSDSPVARRGRGGHVFGPRVRASRVGQILPPRGTGPWTPGAPLTLRGRSRAPGAEPGAGLDEAIESEITC